MLDDSRVLNNPSRRKVVRVGAAASPHSERRSLVKGRGGKREGLLLARDINHRPATTIRARKGSPINQSFAPIINQKIKIKPAC